MTQTAPFLQRNTNDFFSQNQVENKKACTPFTIPKTIFVVAEFLH